MGQDAGPVVDGPAGWSAHNLNASGKFLVSAPGHDTPKRARAYLLTDQIVTETAAR
jgi:S-DNA-T family DNA segregation ATPase FtsK/SpoIIIE